MVNCSITKTVLVRGTTVEGFHVGFPSVLSKNTNKHTNKTVLSSYRFINANESSLTNRTKEQGIK